MRLSKKSQGGSSTTRLKKKWEDPYGKKGDRLPSWNMKNILLRWKKRALHENGRDVA
jgi:hypothetical protein